MPRHAANLTDMYNNNNNTNVIQQEFDEKNLSKQIPSSARMKYIEERSKIKTGNYEELEKHDQFWRDHKLLLQLFIVLGVVPVTRKTGHIEFTFKSYIFLYAFVFYCITSTIVCLVGYERMEILLKKSRKFDEYIYSIIFILYLIPHFFIPYIGWAMGHQICDYKNSWGRYQLKYFRVTGKGVEFPGLSRAIIIITIGCLVVAIVFLMSLSALLAGFTLYHTTAYYHIITIINMNCALWYINCRAMGDASKCYADSFDGDMEEHCNAYILYKYRVLWLDLSDMLQRLGNTYTRTYVMYTLFMFLNITVAVYGFVSEVLDHGITFSFKEIGLFVNSIYCVALLYIFCDCSEKATNNISKRVQDTLMTIDMNTIDQGAKKEIDLFLVAIQMNPPVVSLQGYGDVDKNFFTSNMSMIAIYLVVLIQFKVSFQMMYT